MYCRDVKQLCDDIGNPQVPHEGKDERHALADARRRTTAYEVLVAHRAHLDALPSI